MIASHHDHPCSPVAPSRRILRTGRCLRRSLTMLASAVAALFAGCPAEHPQSALHPVSPAAAKIAWLWWVMFGVLTAVFVIVIVLTLIAVFRKSKPSAQSSFAASNGFIVIGGILIPAVILVVLLLVSLETTIDLGPPKTAMTVQVTGHLWWWSVHYPEQQITTANEIHIPVGVPVRLELTTADVIHSFWVPNLNGKMDLLPDVVNAFWIQADRPGIYRGQCAEYCGLQHAHMALLVVAMPPDEFRAWSEERRRPPIAELPEPLERGRVAFFRNACHTCHAIRGTEAKGLVGPDLTHIGSRLTLGAGTIPNTHGNLAGWIANPQAIKPGNKMPATYLSPIDLHALRAYLQSLK